MDASEVSVLLYALVFAFSAKVSIYWAASSAFSLTEPKLGLPPSSISYALSLATSALSLVIIISISLGDFITFETALFLIFFAL